MGEYHMQTIARWERIGNVEVPVDEHGHYLDWHQVSQDKTKARDLTNPYGILEYAIGNAEGDESCEGDWTMFFDFAALPDGRIILHSVVNTESGAYIGDGEYIVAARETAVEIARRMTDFALECVAEQQVRHDEEGWNQSPCYFWRSVHAYVTKTGPAIRIPVTMTRRGINTRNYL